MLERKVTVLMSLARPLRGRPSSRLFVYTALALALALGAGARVLAQSTRTLSALEGLLPASPALQADELQIKAATEGVQAVQDKVGPAFTYDNDVGPQAIIELPQNLDDHVLRFEQTAGLTVPLDTHIDQVLSLLDAEKREQLARIAMNQAYRERLAELREAYLQYWTDMRQVDAAQTYLSNEDENSAHALLRNGFWTQNDLLDFLETIASVRAQQDEDRSLADGEFALVQSAVGQIIAPFVPTDPTFYTDCSPNRQEATESAEAVDATLGELEAEGYETAQLAKAPGSSVDAAFETRAGSVTDINHHISGYGVVAGVDLALPFKGGGEQHALRAQYAMQLQAIALQEQQRRIELTALVDSLMAQLSSESATLRQALAEQHTRMLDLKTAIEKSNTIKQEPQIGFADVHAKADALYASERAVNAETSTLYLDANNLLLVAPGACGDRYDPIPVRELPESHSHRAARARG